MRIERGGAGVATRLGASIAISWLLLLSSSAGLGWILPGSMWHNDRLHLGAKLGLLASAATALGPVAVVLGFCIVGVAQPAHRQRLASTVGRQLVRATCGLVIFSLVTLYAASWGSFQSTGAFLDRTSLGLFRAEPTQFIQHIALLAPATGMIVAVATVVATLVLVGLVSPRVRSMPHAVCRRMVMLTVVSFEFAIIIAGRGELTYAQDTRPRQAADSGSLYTLAHEYRVSRERTTGPARHLIQRRAWRKARRALSQVKMTVPVDTERIRSMRRYLADTGAHGPRRWNIIVLVVESLRSDRMTAAGGNRVAMPRLEALARQARVFPQLVANATHSNYAALVPLCGQYPLRAPEEYIYAQKPLYPRVLLYDILKPLGYHTGIFSSQNEYWGGMYSFLATGSVDRFVHAESYAGPTYVPETDAGFAQFVHGFGLAGKIDDRFTVGAALGWLDSLRLRDVVPTPFIMYVNLQSSHVPYRRPADFPPRFGPGTTSFPVGFNEFPRDSASPVEDLYDNSLAYADAQIGRLVDYLRLHDLWRSTVLIVTGDHGQAFYEHGFAAHGNLPYAELARVPLLVHAPRLTAGIDDRPAQGVDIAPTVLSLLGLPPHPAFQGISLVDTGSSRVRPLFSMAQTTMADGYSVTLGDYTLILDDRDGLQHLFDDRIDRGQVRDLSDQLPAIRDSLRHALDMWRAVQLRYYGNPEALKQWYVPSIRF